jgi:hypothetical protein
VETAAEGAARAAGA